MDLLTITAPGSTKDLKQRKGVVITARIHPGESNSSFIINYTFLIFMFAQGIANGDIPIFIRLMYILAAILQISGMYMHIALKLSPKQVRQP